MSGAQLLNSGSHSDQNVLNYCTSGDIESLRRCSAAVNKVVHSTFADGQTCLIAACRNGHREVAEFLISECGADVEQVGVVEFESEQVEGVPPLWCAAAAGHLPVVELLISHGADVNRTTITNSTALRAACFDGHEQVVRYLVQHGANVEIPNRHGHTCLMITCYRRHDRIVEFLLSKKARVNRRSAKGNTALHDCAESGNLKGLQLLLEHGAIMRQDEYGQSPIMSGANAAFKKIVDYLSTLADSPHCSSQDSTAVSIHEKIAAYELLGASLFDRHSLVQDALTSWFHALSLRQSAGTYPKTFAPSTPLCDCVTLESSNVCTASESAYTLGPKEVTRISPNNLSGSNWYLVGLATREAVFLSSSPSSPCSSRLSCPFFKRPSSRRLPLNAHPVYQKKESQLRTELYEAYRKEIRHLGLTAPMRLPVKDLPSSGGSHIDNNSHPPKRSPPSTTPLSNSIAGLAHPATSADPLRDMRPQFWVPPAFRRWCPHRPPPLNAPSAHHRCVPPCSHVEYCGSCARKILRFGRRVYRSTSEYIQPQCTPCACDSNRQVSCVQNVRHERMLHDSYQSCPSSLSEEQSFKVPPVSAPCSSNLQSTGCLCLCHRLAPDDHPLVRRLRQCGEDAFGHVREFSTSEELTDLMRNTHSLRLQPLLIRLRILGPDHPDTIYFIRYRGAIYADSDNFHQCLNLWRYALELQRIFLEPLCHVSQAAFVSFAELFQFVLTNNYSGLPAADLDPRLIVDCLELAVDNIERGMDYSFYHWHQRYPWSYTTADKEAINLMRHVVLCLHFIAMLLTHYLSEANAIPDAHPLTRTSRGSTSLSGVSADAVNVESSAPSLPNAPLLRPELNSASGLPTSPTSESTPQRMLVTISDEVKKRFFSHVYRLVKLDPRVHDGQSLIHLACSPETSTVGRFIICRFPNPAVLSLLFELGADPNCPDVHGRRPFLNVLTHRRLQVTEQAVLASTLVQHGAHLDAINSDGLSPLDPRFRHILLQSDLHILDHTTLACAAARVVRRTGLSTRSSFASHIPDNLWPFLEMH